jgi:hypothetical protein
VTTLVPPPDHTPPTRREEVRSPSARGEALAVLRVAATVVCLAAAYIAGRATPGAAARGGQGRPPYQRPFAELAPPQQKMFRALAEGILEAETVRSSSHRWPPPAELAGAGIPPFAGDPTSRHTRWRWTLSQEGLLVNYLGLPSGGDPTAYLVVFLEPDPAVPHGPVPSDEEHHRLIDGTVLHVSVWMRPSAPSGPPKAIALPPAAGWLQLVSGAPRGETASLAGKS